MKKFPLLIGALLRDCTGGGSDITFHGTLMSPPACSISGGQTIEVQFRDLIIDSIDGNNGPSESGLQHYSDPMCATMPEWNMTLCWTGLPDLLRQLCY